MNLFFPCWKKFKYFKSFKIFYCRFQIKIFLGSTFLNKFSMRNLLILQLQKCFWDFFLILSIYKYISRTFCFCKIWWVKGSLLFNKWVHFKEEKGRKKNWKKIEKLKSTKKNFFREWKKCSFPQKLNNRIIMLICLLFNYFLYLYKHIREYSINQSILMILTLKLCLLAHMISFYFRIYR